MAMAKRAGSRSKSGSALTRSVNKASGCFKSLEFEILFVLFFIIVFLLFKELTSRPEYNQILLKKPDAGFWPY